MAKNFYGFGRQSDFIRTQRAVMKVEQDAGQYRDMGRGISQRQYQVKFTEDLEGTDDYQTPTKAKAIILTGHRDDDELGEFDSNGDEVQIYNRTSATKAIDDYATVTQYQHDDKLYLEAGAGTGGGDYFWFTVVDLVCPGDDPYTFPDGGLIVSATYSSTGEAPVDDIGGIYNVFDYLGILDYSLDAVDSIVGSKGRASRGAPIGSSDFKWILDSIKVNPICS